MQQESTRSRTENFGDMDFDRMANQTVDVFFEIFKSSSKNSFLTGIFPFY